MCACVLCVCVRERERKRERERERERDTYGNHPPSLERAKKFHHKIRRRKQFHLEGADPFEPYSFTYIAHDH